MANTMTAKDVAHELPALPYDFAALEPYIDAQTMQLHHDKHHGAYVTNLNAALDKHPEWKDRTLEELMRNVNSLPEDIRTTVRNNGGGHVNHSMFWKIMKPNGGGNPSGEIARVVDTFGGFEAFKEKFNDNGLKRFGSGWTWLVRTSSGKYDLLSTPNQDSPYIDGSFPVMGNDVWEHAYYLKYQNRRGDYLKAWWNVVNWDEINRRLKEGR